MIITGSKLYKATDSYENGIYETDSCKVLYDMEAAAIYEAASHYVGPHQMHFLKFVSDKGEEKVTLEMLKNGATVVLDKVTKYLELLQKHKTSDFIDDEIALEEKNLFEELHASVTMQHQIRQLLRYWKVADIDYQSRLTELRTEQKLPCKDKRQGLKVLEELRSISRAKELKESKESSYKKTEDISQGSFKHIYVEKEILDNTRTKRILDHFPNSDVIVIDHYKDVFNRKRQDFMLQRSSRNLILASKKGRLVYDGAPVCQDFGNSHFYYTSCIMNCLYDCEYCYLKGMYPSANLVVFVNIEDIFKEVEELLEKFPVYLCVSYDTDMMAIENLTGFIAEWVQFTKKHKNLTIEIRTKCGRKDLDIEPCERVIFAWTISPDPVIEQFEHGSARMYQRLDAARFYLGKGWPVRLCFDPMIYIPSWKDVYGNMIEETANAVDMTRVRDYSVGSFRISESYLKKMRKAMPLSAVVQFPFVLENGYYHYPDKQVDEMENYLIPKIKSYCKDAEIFTWTET